LNVYLWLWSRKAPFTTALCSSSISKAYIQV
jgi:hypothetical protein